MTSDRRSYDGPGLEDERSMAGASEDRDLDVPIPHEAMTCTACQAIREKDPQGWDEWLGQAQAAGVVT